MFAGEAVSLALMMAVVVASLPALLGAMGPAAVAVSVAVLIFLVGLANGGNVRLGPYGPCVALRPGVCLSWAGSDSSS